MKIGYIKYVISQVAYDVFLVSFGVFIVSFLLEAQWSGVVARWVNINTILMISFLSGFLALLTSGDERAQTVQPSLGYWIGAVAISGAAGWIVWRMSLSLGPWAFVAAVGVSLIILLMSAILAAQTPNYE